MYMNIYIHIYIQYVNMHVNFLFSWGRQRRQLTVQGIRTRGKVRHRAVWEIDSDRCRRTCLFPGSLNPLLVVVLSCSSFYDQCPTWCQVLKTPEERARMVRPRAAKFLQSFGVSGLWALSFRGSGFWAQSSRAQSFRGSAFRV